MNHSDFMDPPTASPKALKRQQAKAEKDRYRQRVLEPRTPKQATLISLLKSFPVVFAIGAAGSGKTYIPSAFAAQQLNSGVIDRIVMARPTAAPARHKIGFRPGTEEQKMKSWTVPIMNAIGKVLPPNKIEQFRNAKQIEMIPFENMRGLTIENAFFILDEAQNCTLEDLELILTRVGENCTLVICGDVDQDKDLGFETSGLSTVVDMAQTMGMNAGIMIFDENDVVRSATAAEWVKGFKKWRRSGMLSENPMMRPANAA